MLRITGVDPGLVHTGIVTVQLEPLLRRVTILTEVIDGIVGGAATASTVNLLLTALRSDHVFIEAYVPRSHFGTDARMMELVRDIKKGTRNSKLINNTGSKQVISKKLLQLLHLDKFPTTHHQDLQAAARILVFGMMKDAELNRVLYDFVEDNLDGRPWEFL